TVGVAASYTLQLSNTGTAATTAVSTITDTIPAGLTIGTLPAGCSAVGQTVTCTVAAGLAAGGSTSFVIPVTPTLAATPSVTNTASVSGGGDPTCPADARCSDTEGPTPVNPTIDAVDDDFTATPINGASGGTTATVIANDTTNGVAAVIGTNVTLTPGASPAPGLTMNPDGTITVAAGTVAGVYAYPYTICTLPATVPATCDTATATIVVDAALIDAVDDTGAVANGASGGTAVANVLVNDT
ncbi:MAG: hypothetical protein ACOY82_01965, partial [Pseudomonadota bacterium]